MRDINNTCTMVIAKCEAKCSCCMLKYFRGYHRPTKINLHEYLPHE